MYGSLRPDDTSGQQWTKDFVAGAEATPARLRGASLYQEHYAAVVLEEEEGRSRRRNALRRRLAAPLRHWLQKCSL